MMLQFYQLLYAVIPRLPLAFSYWLAKVVADVLWLLRHGRANVEHNQRRALGPDATAKQVALSSRKVFRTLTRNYVDEFHTPFLTPAILERVDFHGLEHLDAALAQGRGVILSSAHYGAPYLVGQAMAIKGYPFTVIAERLQPEALFQWLVTVRERLGLRVVPIDAPLLGVIRELKKENRIVGIVADRNVAGTGICLTFFGEVARFPTGAVRLAIRTGAPLVVVHCRHLPGNRYEATFEPLELPAKPSDVEAAVRQGMRDLLAHYEAFIREVPEQWVLTTPLWSESCRDEAEHADPQTPRARVPEQVAP